MSRSERACAGRVDGAFGEVHGAVGVGERAELLAPRRRRQDDVGEAGRLGEEEVLDDHEEVRTGTGSAGSGRGPAATRRGWWPRSTAVGSTLARRSGRSAWHAWAAPSAGSSPGRRSTAQRAAATWAGLSQLRIPGRSPSAPVSRLFCAVGCPFIWNSAGARTPEHPAQQVDVVDLAGRRGRLVRLVEALQHRAQQPFARAEQLGGRADLGRRDVADRRHPLGRVRLDGGLRAPRSRWCGPARSPRRSSRCAAAHGSRRSSTPRWCRCARRRERRPPGRRAWRGGRRRAAPAGSVPDGGRASASTAPSGSRRSCGPTARGRRSGRRRV